MLLSVVLCQAATLAALWRTGRVIAPGSLVIPAIDVSLAAGGSLFVGMTHQYFVEPMQAFAVASVFVIAAEGLALGRAMLLGRLMLAVTIGMAAKVSTPLYALFPGILAVVLLLPRRGSVSSPSGVRLIAAILVPAVVLKHQQL